MFDTLYRFCYNQYIETFAKCLILVSLFVQTPVNQSKIEANSDTIGVVKSALEQAPVKEFPDFKENYRKTVLEAPKPIPVPEPVIQAPPPPTPVIQPQVVSGDIPSIIIAAANAHGINANMMLRIARCESGFNPLARNRNYRAGSYGNPVGLFQHVEGYWPARANKYGYPGASVFDPVANANVTAAMMKAEGLGAWECK